MKKIYIQHEGPFLVGASCAKEIYKEQVSGLVNNEDIVDIVLPSTVSGVSISFVKELVELLDMHKYNVFFRTEDVYLREKIKTDIETFL